MTNGKRNTSRHAAQVRRLSAELTAARADLARALETIEGMTQLTTPEAIAHLRELLRGTGACVAIDDGREDLDVIWGPESDSVRVRPEGLGELVAAIAAVEHVREEQQP